MREHTLPPRSPRQRPPIALRALVALVAMAMVLFNAALMLSDRAPGVTRALGGDFAERLSARIDARGRIAQVAGDPRLPESDTLVHIGVWAVAMALVGMAVWTWRALLVAAIAVLGLSVVVELGQARWSDTRIVEFSDVRANTVGVLIGVVFVAGCYLAWSAVASLLVRR